MRKMTAIWAGVFLLLAAGFVTEPKVQAADTKKPTLKVEFETEKVTADSLKLTITAKDNVGIAEFRYASGKQNTAYFRDKKKGTSVSLLNGKRTFRVKSNKTYTFYAADKAGNTRILQVPVSNIDKEAPVLKVKTPEIKGYTNKNQYFSLTAEDDLAGIAVVKYAYGKRDQAYFQKNGTEIKLKKDGTGRAVIKKSSVFTFYIKDKVGHENLYVSNVGFMDKTAPTAAIDYSVKRQVAAVTVNAKDDLSGVTDIRYLSGWYEDKDAPEWQGAPVVSNGRFTTKKSGPYTFRLTDAAGNTSLQQTQLQLEFRAAWITYIEYAPSFKYTEYTYDSFTKKINTMFDQCVAENLNAVIVQVRPFSDALYQSAYFPWSGYIAGEQGKNPGFDPMAYMVDAAHARGLEFHAYLNPYRVETEKNYELLSADNPAKRWLTDADPANDRNVLLFSGNYYYNPASREVQELIVNGVREIVANYDVDGIHFDDYFYPTLGSKYKSNFDAVEYGEYTALTEASGQKAKDIVQWRRDNVSDLVSKVYSSIKAIDPSVVFGISPAGNINNLRGKDRYYVDVNRWLSEDGFLDYICPQIYWGFEHSTCPFERTTDQWSELITNPDINLYVGLALYNAGTSTTNEWKSNDDIIARQVKYLRKTGFADGFFLYRYDFLTAARSKAEMNNLRKLLK